MERGHPYLSFDLWIQNMITGLATLSDAVASRLQISDLYKFDLQVASQFANWSKRAPEHVY